MKKLREFRGIRNKRFQRRRSSSKRRLFSVLIGIVIIGTGVMFVVSKVKTKSSQTELTPGKIYTQEGREDIPQGENGTSADKGPEEETTISPESFTFYKVLNSKEGDIVPLSGDMAKPAKKEEREIKIPADEKISEIEKEIDKNLEKNLRRDNVYAVQVAALSNESAANEVMFRLKLQGYAPYLIKGDDKKGERLYKVRVGRFSSIVDAQEVARVLKKDGYDTYVIKAE